MKTLVFLITIITSPFIGMAQTKATDHDIVKALLGQNIYAINPALDKLGIWYSFHFKDNKNVKGEEVRPKIYSIANSEGRTKVYIIRFTKELSVNEIIINYRHDDRNQVEDLKRMPTADEFHVGTYSTDLVYRLK